jgi:hypothetical protein
MFSKTIFKIAFSYLMLFVAMIIVNHIHDTNSIEQYRYKDMLTTHESTKKNQSCTWQCHSNTAFCKKNHVKYLKNYFNITDPIYFKIINSLKSTGDYQSANVIILVFLLPCISFYFLFRGFESLKNNI